MHTAAHELLKQILKSEKYKLLIVATTSATLAAFLIPFAEHFRGKNWTVDALAKNSVDNPDLHGVFDSLIDIEWTRNPWNLKLLWSLIPKVKKIIQNTEYDIVHVHTPIAAFLTRLAISRIDSTARPAVIYTAHGFHFHKNGKYLPNMIFLLLEKLAGKWTNIIITINKDDYKSAVQNKLLHKDNIFLTPGIGVEPNHYQFQGPDNLLAAELDLPAGSRLLLCISEFTKNKRHTDQVQALAKLNRKDVHLIFAGTGPTQPEVKKLVATLDLSSRVHFLGFRNDIGSLLSNSDAALLTSQREGLPRSILEAFSSGTPVIGSRARGTEDLLSNNCGLIVDIGDIEALSNAMDRILGDPALAGNLRDNARTKLAEYSITNVLGIHEEIYNRVLSTKSGTRGSQH